MLMQQSQSGAPKTANGAMMVALAWLVVLAPLAWGVERTVATSMNLFKSPHTLNVSGDASAAPSH